MDASDRLPFSGPEDWHVHWRDGDMLRLVAPDTARQFARAIIMPNLAPPVTTAEAAGAYRRRILDALPEGSSFDAVAEKPNCSSWPTRPASIVISIE